jgi:elongation factor Ts
MADFTTADVVKLRKTTGAGMMDCKNALNEANGNFDKALDIIRKKGQLVASKRADREATEGVVLTRTTADGSHGVMIVLNCETDFVAENEKFIQFAESILNVAVDQLPASLDELKKLDLEGKLIEATIVEQVGVIGEKLDLSFYAKLEAGTVVTYIHPGNNLASMVGFNKKPESQVGKDIAMQVAAMNPLAVDKEQIPQDIIDKEIEIGKDQARQEGKPDDLLERIALGKLNKFFKEKTLMNQAFIKDNKQTIRQYLEAQDKELQVTGIERFNLKD